MLCRRPMGDSSADACRTGCSKTAGVAGVVESNRVEPQHESGGSFTTGAGARRLGTVEHIRLNFIALAASEDVVVQALAVVMRFDDGKSQLAAACRTHHFRGNRAGRLLSKHGTPLPAALLGAYTKGAPLTARV